MTEPESNPGLVGPTLTVAAVARRLGVASATLRTWDRRYGVGPSTHNAGSHRKYSPADVERLEIMRRLTLAGVTPAEAARVALSADATTTARSSGSSSPADHGRGGGGRVVALPGASPALRGLARAAMALDAPSASSIVVEHLQRYGTAWTWEHLLAPVLIGIGDRWETTGTGVEAEHVLSEVVLAALPTVASTLPEPTTNRPVLLACAPEEQHSLPVHVLACSLAERRVGSLVMGGRVPLDALAAAVLRCGPSAVFLWAHQPDVVAASLFNQIPLTRPPAKVVVGGPGWDQQLPPAVVRVQSLAEAVEVLTRAALG
ncbi:MAG TPA: MerR family transcriptional regulator [Actinomycetes bacterium]|nr:MerR family transcriptional regulator [Actinomycetes bacterium]